MYQGTICTVYLCENPIFKAFSFVLCEYIFVILHVRKTETASSNGPILTPEKINFIHNLHNWII